MRRGIEAAAAVCLAAFGFINIAFGQLGGGSSAPAAQPAISIPISGRSNQNGSVTTSQAPMTGTTTTVNTITPTVQVQGPYSGSTPGVAAKPFSGRLGLREAVDRGLAFNLGEIEMAQAVRQTEGQARSARSNLLPNVNGSLGETVQQSDLKAFGLRLNSPIPGFNIPAVVGPFNYFDLRARLTQTVVDITAKSNYRAAEEIHRAGLLSAADARQLIVLGVGGAYLQVIAAKARIDSVRVQLETARALYQQTQEKRNAGVSAQLDVDRSEVETLTQQQRLLSLQNDLAKQKINLARMTGLPPTDQYDVTDDIPYASAPALTVDDALKESFENRSDLKAAGAQVRAGERALSAARAEQLPSLSLSGDYGVIGLNPAQSHGTFTAAASLRFPIWQGGRAGGDIEQARAALAQRQAELQDLQNQIEADLRKTYLDLETATSQVEVARRNQQVAAEALDLTRQRFEAGVTDNVEVIQSQENVAGAQLDYINSVFAHNLAKLTLARSIGRAAEALPDFLKLP
ncbi:MAG TPA: TolC family protein [Terriglobia bacterium]|jgi:outer membrane protein TolC